MANIQNLRRIFTSIKEELDEHCGANVTAEDMLWLLDQLEAAQKDAARYQWIRETYSEDGIEFWPDAVAFADTEEKLDAAIDAAMDSKS